MCVGVSGCVYVVCVCMSECGNVCKCICFGRYQKINLKFTHTQYFKLMSLFLICVSVCVGVCVCVCVLVCVCGLGY